MFSLLLLLYGCSSIMLRAAILSAAILSATAAPSVPNLDNDVIDISYLGAAIYGLPKNETGSRLSTNTDESAANPEEFGEYAEGDILFPPPSRLRNGLASLSTRWPDAIVPYEIAGSYTASDLATINRAIDIYRKYTCVQFRKRTAADSDYVAIVNGATGCWSSVGRISGRQEVNLQSPYCTTKVGTPLHELMHALGFLHEHTRWERDSYVSIAWQNIKSGHDNNFKKADKEMTDAFGVHYDYRSVMHYSPTAFSVNGKSTIIPKVTDSNMCDLTTYCLDMTTPSGDSTKNLKMGQRDGFSAGDITKINAMYGCPKKSLNISSNKETQTESATGGGGSGTGGSSGGGGGGFMSFLYELIT